MSGKEVAQLAINHGRLAGFQEATADELDEQISTLRRALRRYCEYLSGSDHDAEDLVQTTLLKAISVLKSERAHPKLLALLRRIAKNTWIDEVRNRAKYEFCDPDVLAKLSGVEPVDRSSVAEALHILIMRLTPQQRAVFLLCDVFQYTDREAAELLGITRGAVKAALHRARLRLESIAENVDVGPPGNEQQKGILEAYVAAFQAADIRALIHLCQGEALDPVLATTKVLTFAERQLGHSKAADCNTISMLTAA